MVSLRTLTILTLGIAAIAFTSFVVADPMVDLPGDLVAGVTPLPAAGYRGPASQPDSPTRAGQAPNAGGSQVSFLLTRNLPERLRARTRELRLPRPSPG